MSLDKSHGSCGFVNNNLDNSRSFVTNPSAITVHYTFFSAYFLSNNQPDKCVYSDSLNIQFISAKYILSKCQKARLYLFFGGQRSFSREVFTAANGLRKLSGLHCFKLDPTAKVKQPRAENKKTKQKTRYFSHRCKVWPSHHTWCEVLSCCVWM